MTKIFKTSLILRDSWFNPWFESKLGDYSTKAETVRGIEYNQRYAACTYDSFDLITGTHRGLHHAGKSKLSNITYYMILCLVRFYTNNFYTNQELIKLMNEFLSYIMELLKKKSHGYFQNAKSVPQIKPIGSCQVLLRLLVNDA